MKRLELRLEARAEFLDAVRYYESQRAGLGARFKAEVDRTLTRIATAPQQFAQVEPGYRRAVVHNFPYGVFFMGMEEEIVILAILHSRRNPEVWKSRR
jgi:plasmid stabilization system protein ParE